MHLANQLVLKLMCNFLRKGIFESTVEQLYDIKGIFESTVERLYDIKGIFESTVERLYGIKGIFESTVERLYDRCIYVFTLIRLRFRKKTQLAQLQSATDTHSDAKPFKISIDFHAFLELGKNCLETDAAIAIKLHRWKAN